MANVKFGLSQISETTPILYTRIQTAINTILLPSVTAFMMSVVPKSDQPLCIACVVFFGALVSAIGVCLGVPPATPPTPPSPPTSTPVSSTPKVPGIM
jgi:hypothetical protein